MYIYIWQRAIRPAQTRRLYAQRGCLLLREHGGNMNYLSFLAVVIVFEPKCSNFSPAGDPKAKLTWKSRCWRNIQKLVGAAGHTHRKF